MKAMTTANDILRQIHRPMYVVEELRLRGNLSLIRSVAQRAGVDIILAFKAFALWKTFPIFREYISSTTASSLSEARLAFEQFGSRAHTYSPAYTDDEIDTIARCSSHLTFNSLSQYERYADRVKAVQPDISLGLRVNPEYSEVETMLYNPCAPGTRFGISADKLPDVLPEGVEGFHCHCHCESGADVFQRTLQHIEEKFARWFPQLKWMNFGGGHLMTRADYDVDLLVHLLQDFKKRYPHLHVIMEPGSAFAWQTVPFVAQVADIVEDKGIRTAILNVSFTCHMPDCLEMPYQPEVRGGKLIDNSSTSEATSSITCAAFALQASKLETQYCYRLGGNSCLSGDYMGMWQFDHELQVGENIIFEVMIHYTTVKTNTFNGVSHPAIAMLHEDGILEILREFTYEDYRDRMD
jgi:carboxynorspermidine decarboxylase